MMVFVLKLFFFSIFLTGSSSISVFLSPTGNDVSGDGSFTNPFKTPSKIQSYLRKLGPKTSSTTIYFREGVYSLTEPMLFDQRDNSAYNTVWTSYNNEKVVIQGSTEISKLVQKVEDERILSRFDPQVSSCLFQVSLSSFDISPLGTVSPDSIILYSDTESFIYSRYPADPHKFLLTTNYLGDDTWSIDSETGDWIKKWQSLPVLKGMDDDVRIHAYPAWNWDDHVMYLKSLSSKSFQIDTSKSPIPFPQRIKQARWNLLNLLDALQPFSFYINRATKMLYFVDPSPSKYYISTFASPLFSFNETKNIVLSNLIFQHGQSHGLYFLNTESISVSNCVIKMFAGNGVSVEGPQNKYFTFTNNEVSDVYFSGVQIHVGDRLSLTQSRSLVDSNVFRKAAQWKNTYEPFVNVGFVGGSVGCGVNVSNNDMKGYHPHSSILFGGNYVIISNNEIQNSVSACADCGVIYGGRDWTYNVVISKNKISNCNSDMSDDTTAIYLDDEISNVLVEENEIANVNRGLLLGGGRWDIVRSNSVKNASVAAFHFDWRGENWQHDMCSKPTGTLQERYFQMKINSSVVWQKQFPWLVNLLQDDPCVAKFNQFLDNTFCNVKTVFQCDPKEIVKRKGIVSGNHEQC